MKINFQTIKVDHGYGEYERSRGIDYTEALRLAKRARCKDAGAVLPGRLGQTRIRIDEPMRFGMLPTVAIRFHRTDVVKPFYNELDQITLSLSTVKPEKLQRWGAVIVDNFEAKNTQFKTTAISRFTIEFKGGRS